MSTTGLKSSGDFSGVNDALKYVYTDSFNTTIEGEQEVGKAFTAVGDFQTVEGSDGKGIQIPMYMSAGGGFSFMAEDGYTISSSKALYKQASLTIKQSVSRAQVSGRVMRRMQSSPAAVADWASQVLTERAKRHAFHVDRALVGAGTGIIGRINSNPPDGTGDQIDTAYGISGLEGAIRLFLRGDLLRYGPSADGSSLRTGTVEVDSLDYSANSGAGAFNTLVNGSTATATSAADNDFVFLGDDNVNGSGSVEIMGLEGHIDNGTNVTTYQGLTRSSYADTLYSQIIDGSTFGTAPGTLSEDVIAYAADQAYEIAGGRTNLVLCSRSGARSFWKSLKADRTINDPQGQFTGGKKDAGLFMRLGNDLVEVRFARKIPSSRCYGIDTSTMLKFQIGPGRWDDTSGSVWRPVQDSTGVKDAYYALFIQELETGCAHPAKNWKITGLTAA